jgi:hypothetical protein
VSEVSACVATCLVPATRISCEGCCCLLCGCLLRCKLESSMPYQSLPLPSLHHVQLCPACQQELASGCSCSAAVCWHHHLLSHASLWPGGYTKLCSQLHAFESRQQPLCSAPVCILDPFLAPAQLGSVQFRHPVHMFRALLLLFTTLTPAICCPVVCVWCRTSLA